MGELSLDNYFLDSIVIDQASHSNKPWIVLVNGLFASLNSWDEHVKMLKPYFNIIRYNGPGQGTHNSLDEVPTLGHQVEILNTILNHLEREKVYLLGISNGARVAMKYSEVYPDRVIKIISIDTYNKLVPELKLKLQSWLSASLEGGNDLRFHVSTPWIFGESFLKMNFSKVEMFKKLNRSKPAFVGENLIKSALLEEEINLAKLKCPVSFFVGEEDILTPKNLHEEMQAQCQDATLGVLRGGHASVLEFPENLNTILEAL